jgi:7-cyano-7-deazaguanine synthase
MRSDKALLMLSGGLDSATCLYWAKEKYSDISAITFNYFDRLVQEKLATAKLVKAAGIKSLIEIDLPFIKETSDFYRDSSIKKYNDSEALQSASYVPARNMIFYSISAHYAEYLGAKWIIGGHNIHDVKFFKDASIEYMNKLNSLFKEGCLLCNDQAYEIVLPLAEMNRRQIIRLAIELKTPIEMTWSCHRKGIVHCGNCYACRQRLEAFKDLGLKDPVFSSSTYSSSF